MFQFDMSTFTNESAATPNYDPDLFAPTGLDIDQWLTAATSAGATYAVLTAKCAGGFANWPTAYYVAGYDPYSIAQSTWYSANGSPDIVGLFVSKCRLHNLNPVIYFGMTDFTYESRTETTPATDPINYLAMITAQLTELLSNYGDITALWLDSWYFTALTRDNISVRTIYELIKSLQPNCIMINHAHHPTALSEIDIYETDDVLDGNLRYAEKVISIREDGMWVYNIYSSQDISALRPLAEILAEKAHNNANNASYLLGVTPTTAGVLPAAQVTRLGEIGA